MKCALWFQQHKSVTLILALLAMILCSRDLIVRSDEAMLFIDAATFLAFVCVPWRVAHRSKLYTLAFLIPFSTAIAWGTFARAAELYRGCYDNQAALSVLQRCAFALTLSVLSCLSIYFSRQRETVPSKGR